MDDHGGQQEATGSWGAVCCTQAREADGLALDCLPSKRKWEHPETAEGGSTAMERSSVARPCSSTTCSTPRASRWASEAVREVAPAARPCDPQQQPASRAGHPDRVARHSTGAAREERACAGPSLSACCAKLSLPPCGQGDASSAGPTAACPRSMRRGGSSDGDFQGLGLGGGGEQQAGAPPPALALPPGEPAAQWTGLPDDILKRILEHLPPSHLRVLRLVCRSWEGATGRTLRTLRPEVLPQGCGQLLGARFPSLRSLDLSHCMASVCLHTPQALRLQSLLPDARFPDLSALPRLRDLSLRGCSALTRGGLAGLAAASQLRSLNLAGCAGASDDLLRALSALGSLETVNLQGCAAVTDAGLAHLLALPSLRQLVLHSTATDAGCALVSLHARLERVACRGCAAITPAGIYSLLGMPALKRIIVSKCPQVTMESLTGVAKLRLLPQPAPPALAAAVDGGAGAAEGAEPNHHPDLHLVVAPL